MIGGEKYEIIQTGSGKKTKRFFRKVGKVAKKANKYLKKKKLVSKGLKTIADIAPLDASTKAKLRTASSMAKKVGYGHSNKDLRYALRNSGGGGLKRAGGGIKLAGGKRGNPWIAHVQAYRKKHPNMSYKQAMVAAKKTYKR